MSAHTFEPIAARPAPVKTEGLVAWIRHNLFGDWKTSLGTVIVLAVLLTFVPRLLGRGGGEVPHHHLRPLPL